MIGQLKNLKYLYNRVKDNNFPKFLILVGEKGSGKTTLAKEIARYMNCNCLIFSSKVEDVRTLITECYNQTKTIIYCISNCQDMSPIAKNALLKIAEEPPKNAYIIMTTTSSEMLPTIISRGIKIDMEEYSIDEISQYLLSISINTKLNDLIKSCVTNLGQCNELVKININEIIELVDSFLSNISIASLGNTLKLTSRFKLKVDGEGIDIIYFILILLNKLYQLGMSSKGYDELIHYTNSYKYAMKAKGLLSSNYSNQAIIDNMFTMIWEEFNGII